MAVTMQCHKCNKCLVNKSSLTRHLREVCGVKSGKIICKHCTKTFDTEFKMKRHVKRFHVAQLRASLAYLDIDIDNNTAVLSKIQSWAKVDAKQTACKCYEEGCTLFSFPTLQSYRNHLIKWHRRIIKTSSHSFSSREDFEYWKVVIEKKIGISYSQQRGACEKEGKKQITYYCRRSGIYKERGNAIRLAKTQA